MSKHLASLNRPVFRLVMVFLAWGFLALLDTSAFGAGPHWCCDFNGPDGPECHVDFTVAGLTPRQWCAQRDAQGAEFLEHDTNGFTCVGNKCCPNQRVCPNPGAAGGLICC